MKDLLKGKWMGHPLHPPMVHLPVGLWIGALIFDVLSLLGDGSNVFVQISFYAIAVGVLVAFAAILPGLADWWDMKSSPAIFKLGLLHMVFNGLSIVLWITNLALRAGTYQTADSVAILPLSLSVVATVALSVSGYLGGRMVYEEGLSVADMSQKMWKQIAKDGGAPVPAKEK
jgi:uncharacterized membrane protein